MVCLGYVLFTFSIYPLTQIVSASVNFLDGTKIEQQRILLAVYPLLYASLKKRYRNLTDSLQVILLHSRMDDPDSIMLLW